MGGGLSTAAASWPLGERDTCSAIPTPTRDTPDAMGECGATLLPRGLRRCVRRGI